MRGSIAQPLVFSRHGGLLERRSTPKPGNREYPKQKIAMTPQ